MDNTSRVHTALSANLPKVERAPAGLALMLLYVLGEVEAAWEVSYHFRPLWDTLRGTREYLSSFSEPRDDADACAAQAVLALMKSLDYKILVENEMLSMRREAHADAADSAARWAHKAAEYAHRIAAEYPDLGAYVLELAERGNVYNSAVATAMRGALSFYAAGTPLDSTISAIAQAERHPSVADTAPASDLRAHRACLTALNREQNSPWLHVNHGRIVYVYPFALRGISPEKAVTSAGAKSAGWLLAGILPTSVHDSLDLDDIWDGSDSLGRRYEGALIELPDVTMRGHDNLEMGRVTCQIRLSNMGNHYVRFEARLKDVSPSDLYAMMFRAAPEHGSIRVTFEGTSPDRRDMPAEEWPRLSDLAMRLAEDTRTRLHESPGTAEVGVVARPGMYQVVVSINSATTGRGPTGTEARREVLTMDELNASVGAQVLTNPITYMVGAIEEWIHYSTQNELSAIVKGLAQEWMVRTPNTILMAAPVGADHADATRLGVAEFVASLDGLFAGWSAELASYYEKASGFQERLSRLDGDRAGGATELARLSRELDAEKIGLNNFTVELRSTLALIQSPSLVASPVVAATLSALLSASGFGRAAEELRVKIDEVVNEQLGIIIEKLTAKRIEKQRVKTEVFLAVISAAGVSGIIQVLQAGYGEGGAAVKWAVTGVIAIVAGAVTLGWWVGRSAWTRG
jgi:hypothetical protein